MTKLSKCKAVGARPASSVTKQSKCMAAGARPAYIRQDHAGNHMQGSRARPAVYKGKTAGARPAASRSMGQDQ